VRGAIDRFDQRRDVNRFERDVGHGNIGAALRDERRIHGDNQRLGRDVAHNFGDAMRVRNDQRRINNDFRNF
jgi:hypothetical protein